MRVLIVLFLAVTLTALAATTYVTEKNLINDSFAVEYAFLARMVANSYQEYMSTLLYMHSLTSNKVQQEGVTFNQFYQVIDSIRNLPSQKNAHANNFYM